MRHPTVILISVLALLKGATVEAQTGECHWQAQYACVGRDQFRECYRNSRGQMVTREPSFSCDSLVRKFPHPVCYGAALNRQHICGAPPPSCRAEGNFPVPATNKPFTSQFQSFTVRNNRPVESNTFRPVNFITTSNFQEQFQTSRPLTSNVKDDNDDDIFTGSKSSTEEQIKCTAPFTRLADPKSCFYFYECTAKNTPVKVLCPFKMRYDEVEKDCKPFAQCGSRPMYRPASPQEQESFLMALKHLPTDDDDATDTDEDL
ncbi:hypothetical protein B566_EDAN007066, partial [Ephemera danica]